ncbi:Quercetin 2,3-dioxygenase [compost metagenome]
MIDAGQGFGTHPHKDMEILTYVLSGTVEHQDSMGNKEQIQAGEFQIMSAGTGVRHSEYNGNNDRPLHLYQIWIIPDRVGLEPRYEQRGSLKVFQDMTLSRWALKQDEQAECPIEAGRRVWIQVVRGKVVVNGQQAGTSDAFAVWDEAALSIHADEDSEILLFDLPPV